MIFIAQLGSTTLILLPSHPQHQPVSCLYAMNLYCLWKRKETNTLKVFMFSDAGNIHSGLTLFNHLFYLLYFAVTYTLNCGWHFFTVSTVAPIIIILQSEPTCIGLQNLGWHEQAEALLSILYCQAYSKFDFGSRSPPRTMVCQYTQARRGMAQQCLRLVLPSPRAFLACRYHHHSTQITKKSRTGSER